MSESELRELIAAQWGRWAEKGYGLDASELLSAGAHCTRPDLPPSQITGKNLVYPLMARRET